MQECKHSNKCFAIELLMKLHIKMPANDSFLIMHFRSLKTEKKTLKIKKI